MHLNNKFSLKSAFCKDIPDFRHAIFDSVKLLNHEHWEEVNEGQLYLSIPYLEALEQTMEGDMEFRYVIFYCEEYQPLGIAYFQLVDLVDNGSKYRDAVQKLGKGIGSYIVKEMKVRTIVNGNVFQCGRFGYQFQDKVPHEAALAAVEETMDRFRRTKEHRGKASIVLFKEFAPNEFNVSDCLLSKRYHMFRMDVNMVMDINTSWKNLEDYEEAITSKSRTRLKSILKKSDAIEVRDMDVEEIAKYADRINELFQQVLEKSSFKFGELKSEIYVAWKNTLKEKLIFKGFFENEVMIGFNSAFVHEDYIDAHYVGIDYEKNEQFSLYQRMLVELLCDAIHLGMKQLIMGRTAEQAKSTLGAYPVDMRLYAKHRNALANKLIAPVLASVKPSEFETRNPFKKVG
jgi:hypothetical protein